MAKNVECKYRVTATIKADTKYELQIIKAKLIGAGAKILRIDPVSPSSEAKNLQADRNMHLHLQRALRPIFSSGATVR
jgi:hypothetical protein